MENTMFKIFFFVTVLINSAISMRGLAYPPKYQPELDQLSLEKYLKDDYLFSMHINCLFYDGPCDPVGRWMKPRMASYFLSSCVLCTPNQEKETSTFMTWLHSNHPQLFRIGIAKYLDANGVTLPKNSKFRAQVQKMNVPKVSISSAESSEEQQQPSKESKERGRQEALEDEEETTLPEQSSSILPSQRIASPNTRKNKFSSAISFSQESSASPASKLSRISSLVEDDEAEMDFTFYHR